MRSTLPLLLALSACHRAASDPKTLAELFAGTKAPALTSPVFTGAQWEKPFAPIATQLDKHATDSLHYVAIGGIASELVEIDVLSSEDAVAELTKLWGPPAATAPTGDALHPAGASIWYGDHVRAMAMSGNKRVQLVHFVPLAEQLGAPGDPFFAFERGEPMTGRTRDEIVRRFRDRLQDQGGRPFEVLQLADDEVGGFHVAIHYDKDIVSSLHFYVYMAKELAPARQNLVLARFGKTTLTEDERQNGIAWGDRRVELITSDAANEMWSVGVR